MINIDSELTRIKWANFFSNMGLSDIEGNSIILIENVKKVFVEPCYTDFNGYYNDIKWLPTSMTQEDPFYGEISSPKELVDGRIKMNKAVINALRTVSKDRFIFGSDDFSLAAKNAVCFAFRQYVSEKYFNLGNNWAEIIEIYYSGHWPVGYAKEKIIII